MLMRWFTAIMPKEEKFFDLFARHSEVVLEGGKALRAMLEGGEAVPQHCRAVMDFESKGTTSPATCSSPCVAPSSRRSTAARSRT